ncbi:MAG: hypothetical protein H6644_23085 [Caldilineaceae bacterium]|nr:hypothetical protein [Caldilineaceae bacterium]
MTARQTRHGLPAGVAGLALFLLFWCVTGNLRVPIATGASRTPAPSTAVPAPVVAGALDVHHPATETLPLVFLPIAAIPAEEPPAPPAWDGVDVEPAWTAAWWQWIERTNGSPLYPEGPVDCGLGQTGDTWFLAGTEGGTAVTRSCRIPTGKTLVIPLFTIAWDNEGMENLSVEEKRVVLDEVFSDSVPGILNTKICYLESIVNGMPYQQTRLASPPFQRRADPEAVADGYWIGLALEEGVHDVHVVGRLCDFDTDATHTNVDVAYRLTVEPPPAEPADPWALFVWATGQNDAATGCDPADPTGVVPCSSVQLGRNSVYATTPPWTFTTASAAATLTVVDTGAGGDVFEVYDGDELLGRTSEANAGGDCYVPAGGDPGLCLERENISAGVFPLAAGEHAVTIVPVSGFDYGVGYFRVDDPAE